MQQGNGSSSGCKGGLHLGIESFSGYNGSYGRKAVGSGRATAWLVRDPMSLGKGSDLMGRGRQRAKQRKVARDLKYYSPETDYEALERELSSHSDDSAADDGDYGDEYDEYAELAAKYDIPDDEYDDYNELDDDGSWAAPQGK